MSVLSVIDVQRALRRHEEEHGHTVTKRAPQVLLDDKPVGMAVTSNLWIPGAGDNRRDVGDSVLTSYTKTAEAPVVSEIASGVLDPDTNTRYRSAFPMYPHIYHEGKKDYHSYLEAYEGHPWGDDWSAIERLSHPTAPYGPLLGKELNPDIHSAIQNHSIVLPHHIGTRYEQATSTKPSKEGYIKKDELSHFNEHEAYRQLIDFEENNGTSDYPSLNSIMKPFDGSIRVYHTYADADTSFSDDYVYNPISETLHKVRGSSRPLRRVN